VDDSQLATTPQLSCFDPPFTYDKNIQFCELEFNFCEEQFLTTYLVDEYQIIGIIFSNVN
jgi:hypothetical protein